VEQKMRTKKISKEIQKIAIDLIKKYAIFIILIVVIALFGMLSPVFLTTNNFINVARQISIIMIAAIGATIVIITGGIDLSIGSMLSLSHVLIAIFIINMVWNPWIACLVAMLISLAIGFIHGILITKIKIPPLIVTLASWNILQGIALQITKGMTIARFPNSFKVVGQGYVWIIPVPVIIAIITVALGSLILNKTTFGRYFFAIGGNEEAARLSGVNVDRMKIIAYMSSAFFTTLGAIVLLSRIDTAMATTGQGFEFTVIIAVVLGGISIRGGRGKLSNVVAGVIILGLLANGMAVLNMGAFIQLILKGLILLIAVGFDTFSSTRRLKEI
jgi:ribose transport system permease protein